MSTILNSTEFGITADAPDNTLNLLRALDACRSRPGATLRFAPGAYHFRPEQALELHYFISNNDSGLKRIAFPLIGFNGITIDGGGAELLFHGKMSPFVIDGSNDVTIENLSIDWAEPLCVEAIVQAADGVVMDLRIPEDVKYTLDRGDFHIVGDGWTERVVHFIEFDPRTKAPAYRSGDYCGGPWHSKMAFEEIAPRTVRMTSQAARPPRVGNVIVLTSDTRYNPGFHVLRSSNVTLRNVIVHTAPAMAFVAERTMDIHMDGFNVALRQGSGRLVTATADATHFVNCRGQLMLENCLWENQLDDPVNVHGVYTHVAQRMSDRELLVKLVHRQQKGIGFTDPGDVLSFMKLESLEVLADATVAAVRTINSDLIHLTFDSPLSSEIGPGYAVENMTWNADVTIRKCVARNNRARGLLLSTPGKVLVEHNVLSPGGAAILIGGEPNFWCESGAVKDVLIRNNEFVDCNYGSGWGRAVLDFSPSIRKPELMTGCFHRNVRIEHNTFRTFEPGLLYARSIDGLSFKNNRVERTQTYAPFSTHTAPLTTDLCRNVEVAENAGL